MSRAEATSVPAYTAAHRRDPRTVRAGRGGSLAAGCDDFSAQKRGAEESGTRQEVAGQSQPSWNKHQDWSHGDNLEGR